MGRFRNRVVRTWRVGAPVLAVVLAVLAAWPSVAGAAGDVGMLWRIAGGAGGPSHLFGTVHSDDPRFTTLAEPVAAALAGSRAFIGEVVMNEQAIAETVRLSTQGPPLADLIGETLFRRTVVALAGLGVPEAVTARLRPWAAAVTLSMPPSSGRPVLDDVLQNRARAAGIPVAGLETVAEQLGYFEALRPAKQRLLLTMALDTPRTEVDAFFDELFALYGARDLEALNRAYLGWLDKARTEEERAFNRDFNTEMIEKRNLTMVERLKPRLRKGGVFIAVGALHLPGRGGLIALLRRVGYAVEPVW